MANNPYRIGSAHQELNRLEMNLLTQAVELSNNREVLMLGGAELLSSPSSYIEKHTLNGTDKVLRFAVGRNVVLNVEQQPRVRDSARANSQILSEYKWESKTNYTGRILAAKDKLVAYRLFNETTGEAVRVMEREQRVRHLIKDFRQTTVDLQWAVHAPLLAVLDANANLYIYSVDENGAKLSKYLIIIQEEDRSASGPARIVWCPYIPEDNVENGSGGGEQREDLYMIGVVQGHQVDLYKLNKIKEEIGRTEVSYERVRELDGAMLTIEMESKSAITACRISPDASALATATADGELIFYVMDDWDNIQLANRIRPLANNAAVEDLVFLDNLCAHNQDEQFWKYVALSSDNGRRLALFDCDNWQCIAKLRFECPNQITRMELLVEPSMHFLFVADYDASNLFCIELCQPQQSTGAVGPLCFAACTQVTFCNPMICIVPCSLIEQQYDSANDLSLEDDDQMGGPNQSFNNSSVIISLVAITQRSLLELNVDLDRVFTVDPSIATAATPAVQPMTRSLLANAGVTAVQQQQQHGFSAPPTSLQPSQTVELQRQQHRLEDYDPLAQTLDIAKNHVKQEIDNSEIDVTQNNTVVNTEAVDKLADIVEQKFVELTDKIDDLSMQIYKLQNENEQLRANQADNLSNVLEKISNELKSREERMDAFTRIQAKENAEQMVRSTESLLNKYVTNVQRAVELAQTRQAEQMHVGLERAVVPQIEVLCTQLFQQLNDTFHAGLQEYMEQMKTISQNVQIQIAQNAAQQQKSQLTPMQKLDRLLETEQFKSAFELALITADPELLNIVCKKVDPDVFFSVGSGSRSATPTSNPPPPLPVPLMLQLLLQLANKLESDTDLKFRYVENLLSALSTVQRDSKQAVLTANAIGTGLNFRAVMERLSRSFTVFADQADLNEILKRQTRLINSLIATMLR